MAASFFRSTRLAQSCSSFGSTFCNSICTKYRFATMTQSVACLLYFSYASNPAFPSSVTALLYPSAVSLLVFQAAVVAMT
jgi:hypothetical protein